MLGVLLCSLCAYLERKWWWSANLLFTFWNGLDSCNRYSLDCSITRAALWQHIHSVFVLTGPSRGVPTRFAARGWTSGAAPSATVAAATTSERPSETHTSAEQTHHLREKSATTPTCPKALTSAHPPYILSLGFYSQLAALEKWLIQVLSLHRALLRREFNISLPKSVQNRSGVINLCVQRRGLVESKLYLASA